MFVQDYIQGNFTYENAKYDIFKTEISSTIGGTGSFCGYTDNTIISNPYQSSNNISNYYSGNINDYIITESDDINDITEINENNGYSRIFYKYIPISIIDFNVEELTVPLKFKFTKKSNKNEIIILKYNDCDNDPDKFIIDVLKCKKLKKITFGYIKDKYDSYDNFEYIIKKLKDTDIKLYYKNYSDHNNIIEIN